MADYILKGISASLAYNAPGFPVITGKVDIPEFIANPGLLALVAAEDKGLDSFSGFVQNDTLIIAKIPKGFLVLAAGLRHSAKQNTTLDIGDGAGAATLWSNRTLNSDNAAVISTVLASSGAKVYAGDDVVRVLFDQNVTYSTAAFVVSLVGVLLE